MKKINTICLISDHGSWLNEYDGVQINKFTQASKGIVKLIKYSIRASQKNNLKFIFSFKRGPDSPGYRAEQKWFKENLTLDEYNYIKTNSLYYKYIQVI